MLHVFSPVFALTRLKARPYEDVCWKTRQCKYGFLICLAENRFIEPVVANTGLFNLFDQLAC